MTHYFGSKQVALAAVAAILAHVADGVPRRGVAGVLGWSP